MGFGRTIEGEQVGYWGARAIYQGYSHDYFIDLLWDRQSAANCSEGFKVWLNERALPWLRRRVKELGLGTDDPQVLVLEEFKYRLEASTHASYGYLYIGAVERPVQLVGQHHNAAADSMERVYKCGDKTFVWGADWDIPEPGTKGKVKVNGIGPGKLVSYFTEPYGKTGHELLCLQVKLDKPPVWWKKQTFQRDLEKAMKEHIVARKHKKVGTGWRAEYVPTEEPDKDSLKRFKQRYELPPCICFDGDFRFETDVVKV